MTVDKTLEPMRVQWRAEHRIWSAEKQRIERRLAELEEMLETFFGEPKHG